MVPKMGPHKLTAWLLSCALIINTSAAHAKRLSGELNCSTQCDDSQSNGDCCSTDRFKQLRTAVHFRSQGANTARELVGWQWDINKPEMCENYGAAYVAFEYQRSFKDKQIAQALFGSSKLSFAGSQVTDRAPNELLADYFGLPTDFRGSIFFHPRVENFIVDLGFYMGLDCWMQGLYVRLHAPFVHSRWNLDTNCGNCVNIETGTTNENGTPKQFPLCYMGESATDTASTIKQALSGFFFFGDMNTPWCAGRFDFARQVRNGLADIDVILGYNWINDDCYHFGTYIQAVCPTGKKRKNLYVFSPVVGNGKHFELGAGISAHTVLWSGEDSNLALFLEGNVTHMFRSRQCRFFDLIDNGPFSRYMLLKEFETNGTTFTYANNMINASCFTNREVHVSVGVKADFSLKLAYRWCGFGFDLGYNGYGHSREKIEVLCNSCPSDIDKRKFGIKGTEGTCCSNYLIAVVPSGGLLVPTIFPNGDTFPANATVPPGCPSLPVPPISTVTNLPDNATESDATAFAGGTRQSGTIAATDCAVCLNGGTVTQPTPTASLTTANGYYINNGLQPTLLSVNDIDIHSGEAHSVFTNKAFAHICYTWMDECGWNPQLGVGGEVELDANQGRSACERSGLTQWGVWVKGCVSF